MGYPLGQEQGGNIGTSDSNKQEGRGFSTTGENGFGEISRVKTSMVRSSNEFGLIDPGLFGVISMTTDFLQISLVRRRVFNG